MLFLNVSWMARYQGLANDTIRGGFGYVTQHGYGSELFNFKPYQGQMYGFARAPHDSIKLEKLGAKAGAASVDGVLVIWVANSKIVGWYNDATVFRNVQGPPPGSGRIFKGHKIGYNVTAREHDCTLLDPDARHFPIPRAKSREHAMGRNLWYAEGPTNWGFRARVREYIARGGAWLKKVRDRKTVGSPRQQDPLKRQRIEQDAVRVTTKHFENFGYDVDSVESDNVGWDLNAVHRSASVLLKLEVKGLSGSTVVVEMTPQEYRMMQKHRQGYRVCVVTNCLQKGKRKACKNTGGETFKMTEDHLSGCPLPNPMPIIRNGRQVCVLPFLHALRWASKGRLVPLGLLASVPVPSAQALG